MKKIFIVLVVLFFVGCSDGENGVNGLTGPTGIAGLTGETGDTGTEGTNGLNGIAVDGLEGDQHLDVIKLGDSVQGIGYICPAGEHWSTNILENQTGACAPRHDSLCPAGQYWFEQFVEGEDFSVCRDNL